VKARLGYCAVLFSLRPGGHGPWPAVVSYEPAQFQQRLFLTFHWKFVGVTVSQFSADSKYIIIHVERFSKVTQNVIPSDIRHGKPLVQDLLWLPPFVI
jgi:hypothetical protein